MKEKSLAFLSRIKIILRDIHSFNIKIATCKYHEYDMSVVHWENPYGSIFDIIPLLVPDGCIDPDRSNGVLNRIVFLLFTLPYYFLKIFLYALADVLMIIFFIFLYTPFIVATYILLRPVFWIITGKSIYDGIIYNKSKEDQ